MNYEIEYHDYDVVVVGAGGSGLRATVGAVENGYKTACIFKSVPNQKSHGCSTGRHLCCTWKYG